MHRRVAAPLLALLVGVLAPASAQPQEGAWRDLGLVPPTAASAAFALKGARPNPASRELSISFALAERGPAMLELLDVTGRRQLVREVGELGPGPHVLRLDREVAGLPAGVYLVRLRQGSRVAAGKICVIR